MHHVFDSTIGNRTKAFRSGQLSRDHCRIFVLRNTVVEALVVLVNVNIVLVFFKRWGPLSLPSLNPALEVKFDWSFDFPLLHTL